MQRSEQTLYITLVDFLLQLLFFGLVIGVILSLPMPDDPNKTDKSQAHEKLVDDADKLVKLAGVSSLRELTDQLTRLGPISEVQKSADVGNALGAAVKAAGGIGPAQKVLEEFGAKKAGQGLPNCLGEKAVLTEFETYPDRIEVGNKNDTGDFRKLLSEMDMPSKDIESMHLGEFRRSFASVRRLHPDCRYTVRVVEHSFDTRPRDAVSSVFMVLPTAASDRE